MSAQVAPAARRLCLAVGWISGEGSPGYRGLTLEIPTAHACLYDVNSGAPDAVIKGAAYVADRLADERPSFRALRAHLYVIEDGDPLSAVRAAEYVRSGLPAVEDRVNGRMYPGAAPAGSECSGATVTRLVMDSEALERLLAGERSSDTLNLNYRMGDPFDDEPIE